jgi:hypothetical protein
MRFIFQMLHGYHLTRRKFKHHSSASLISRDSANQKKIYKVEQKHRTRVITNQYIVLTDARGFTQFIQSANIAAVENFLLEYDDWVNDVCDTYDGIIRNTAGDAYFLTFSEANTLFPAIEKLCTYWNRMLHRYRTGITIAIHKGNLNIIRSYLYSHDINATKYLERLGSLFSEKEAISVVVSGVVKEDAKGTNWENNFQPLDIGNVENAALRSIVNEQGAYCYILNNIS